MPVQICSKIRDELSGHLSAVDAAVQQQMAARIPPLLQALLRHEPRPLINTSLVRPRTPCRCG
jgi:hypothetical protein